MKNGKYQCHICVPSSLMGRCISPSQDHTGQHPRSHTLWRSLDRSCPAHTLSGRLKRFLKFEPKNKKTPPIPLNQRLTSVAVASMISRRTDAAARHGVTGSAVLAVTLQLTHRAVETRRAGWRGGGDNLSLKVFLLFVEKTFETFKLRQFLFLFRV